MSDIQAVLSALDVLARASDKASFEKANTWLQDFQHSPEAWSTCNFLLLSQDSPPAARVFAAQTFRAKVTYDLYQVDATQLPALRSTLISALERYTTGPKSIIVQLSLSLSGLAIQYPGWENPVQDIIDKFGRDPVSVPALLQFLTVLPEEINGNSKIPVSNDDYNERVGKILTDNAQKVLDLLTMYMTADGATLAIHNQIFACLRSWVNAGEVGAVPLSQTPLFAAAFDALNSEDLFEAAVEVICDLIHETQEIEDNMPVIQLIVPRLILLKPSIAAAKENNEKIRGYTKIFSEAGEVYRMLVLQHPETFFPLVEAIGECTAYPDLDIVPITFPFWMRLAQSIGKKPNVAPVFFEAYKSLMGVIIKHLHFPEDVNSMSSQEADNFRSFRHVMGDTLKDCCHVLGSEQCLSAVSDLVAEALSRGTSGVVSWQEIEAPLFSLRSMGAEIDLSDDRAVPKIMELIPLLPDHPRVRYAATLVISRYTEWTNNHPVHIPFQLQYISAGFESGDLEVAAAAGQALKFLCQDCKRHMVPYLSQLHTFLSTVGSKLTQEDRMLVYEGVAHVISAMPMQQAALSLKRFSLDILSTIHEAATKPIVTSKQELQPVLDGLENLEVMLHVVQTFGEKLPDECKGTCEEVWAFFDPFLGKYGNQYDVSERSVRVLRHSLKLFGTAARPVALSVLKRMTVAFESTGFSGYLWISGKVVGYFGDGEDPALRAGFSDMFTRCTAKVLALLREKTPRDMPDVMEDFVQLQLQLVELCPDIFFTSSAFEVAFKTAIAALTLIHADIIFASLDLLRVIVTHDCLGPNNAPPPKFPAYAAAIQGVIVTQGLELTGYLLAGLVGDFPEEAASTVITIVRSLAALWPSQLLAWLPQVLEQLPPTATTDAAKKQFVTEITSAISRRELDKVKNAILNLHRFSIRARERRRVAPVDR